MKHTQLILSAGLIFFCGCNITPPSPVELPDGTMSVVRSRNWKQWKHGAPISSFTFGDYLVTGPDQGRTNGRGGYDVSLVGFDLEKSRQEKGLTFDLQHRGSTVATVSAESFRKKKAITTKIGDFGLDEHDWFNGNVALSDGSSFEFQLNDYHSESFNDQATGQIVGNGQTIVVREVKAFGKGNYKGMPAAEFLLNGKRIGLVTRLNRSNIWVDSQQPDDLRTAVSAVAAAILIAPRLPSDS